MNPALCDIWVEKLKDAGDDEEMLAEIAEEIYDQGVSDGRREDAARSEY